MWCRSYSDCESLNLATVSRLGQEELKKEAMGLFRKATSVGTLGIVKYRSKQERQLRYAKQARNETRVQTVQQATGLELQRQQLAAQHQQLSAQHQANRQQNVSQNPGPVANYGVAHSNPVVRPTVESAPVPGPATPYGQPEGAVPNRVSSTQPLPQQTRQQHVPLGSRPSGLVQPSVVKGPSSWQDSFWENKEKWAIGIIGAAAVLGLVGGIGSVVGGSTGNSQPEQLAFADTDTTGGPQPETTAEPPKTTEPPESTTVETTVPQTTVVETTEAGLSEEEILRFSFHILVRQEFPLIDLAAESDPKVLEGLDTTGMAICELAKDSDDQEQFSLGLLLVWAQQDDATKLFFNSQIEDFARFAGFSTGAFCPAELERLSLG